MQQKTKPPPQRSAGLASLGVGLALLSALATGVLCQAGLTLLATATGWLLRKLWWTVPLAIAIYYFHVTDPDKPPKP